MQKLPTAVWAANPTATSHPASAAIFLKAIITRSRKGRCRADGWRIGA